MVSRRPRRRPPLRAPAPLLPAASTLAGLIVDRLARDPGELAIRFLDEGTALGARTEWSRGELAARVAGVSGELRRRLQPGERALLVYPPGPDFVVAFYACLLTGIVAVPAYPPDPSRLGPTVERLRHIAADSGACVVLSPAWVAGLAADMGTLAPELAALPWIATDALAPTDDRAATRAADTIGPGTVAFLQYTSGSTGRPKGVVLTHGNVLANLRQLIGRTGLTPDASFVGWLPTFHDMGLVGHLLLPLELGSVTTLLSPVAFLGRPVEWLRAMSHFRGTTAASPDFGYALCARRATPADVAELDLSTWTLALNGAERIRPATLARFSEVFGPAGFRPETFFPAYGLAEATVFVTGAHLSSAPALRADRRALQAGRVAPAEAGSADTLLQSAGRPDPSLDVRIVSTDGTPAPEGAIGEIWLRGPNVSSGYHGGIGADAFAGWLGRDGPFLRTGDLGLVHEGALYVVGRQKDLLIVRGRNVYPEDIERSVEAADPAVRSGGVAAFPLDGEDEERLGLAVEIDPRTPDPEAVGRKIRAAVARDHEVAVQELALVPPRSLPKTSSGKIMRRQTATMVRDGELPLLHRWSESRRPLLPAPPPGADARALTSWLLDALATALDVSPTALSADRPFAEQGVDSLLGTELAARIERSLGRRVDAVELWNHPTPARLAYHLAGADDAGPLADLADPLADLLGEVEALSDGEAASRARET